MFIHIFLKEKLINLTLVLSLIVVWHLIELKPTNTSLEILKNIGYSIIASIIFYYISFVIPLIRKDRASSEILIDSYTETKELIIFSLQMILPDIRRYTLDVDDLRNPYFFYSYFLKSRHRQGSIWCQYVCDRNFDVDTRELIIDQLKVFSDNLSTHLNNLFLDRSVRSHFRKLQQEINSINGVNDHKLLDIIILIGTATSLSNGKHYDEDVNLLYLNKVNYLNQLDTTVKNAAQYTIWFYFLFWIGFALHVIFN